MARKYEFAPGLYGWAMEKCEEELLIAVNELARQSVTPDQVWHREFEYRFFESGDGVSFDHLAQLNSVLRRLEIEPVEYQETNVYDYGRMRDRHAKSQLRQQLVDEYRDLDMEGRHRWLQRSLDEVERLPPPHRTFDELKAERAGRLFPVQSERERLMREAAVKRQVTSTEAAKSMNQVTLTVRRLQVAKAPETVALIINALMPEEALLVAESGQVTDPTVIHLLVERSLDQRLKAA